MIKRLISLLLMVALLAQCVPLQALADDSHLLTAEELAAALRLAGAGDDAAPYREGMDFSETMHARQLSSWLDELLDNDIAAVKQLHSEMENTLGEMKRENAEVWQRLTQGDNNRLYQSMMQSYQDAEELRQLLRYYRDRLEEKETIILRMSGWFSGEYTRSQQLTASREIEDAVKTIRKIRKTVGKSREEWQGNIDRWKLSFRGAANDGMDDWMDAVRSWKGTEVLKTSVNASAIYPSGSKQSVLGRLSPVGRALADTGMTVDLTTMDKDDIAFEVLDQADQPIADAAVTVRLDDGSFSVTEKTDVNGVLVVHANDFEPDRFGDIGLSVGVVAEGTESWRGDGLTIKKGESMRIYQRPLQLNEQQKPKPYVCAASFKGHDIKNNAYDVLFSPLNDEKFSFVIQMSEASSVTLDYTDVDGVRHDIIKQANQANNITVSFEDTWKSILLPKSTVCVIINENDPATQTKVELKLNIVRGVVDMPVTDWLGVFDSEMGLGFSFKFPASFPSFLRGSSIGMSVPWEEILGDKMPNITVRPILNMNGTYGVYIAYELSGGPFKTASDYIKNNWKNADQKELDNWGNGLARDAVDVSLAMYTMDHNAISGRYTVPFLFGCSMKFDVFFCFVMRYKTDKGWKADLDEYQFSGQFSGGIMATFSMSMKWIFWDFPLIYLAVSIDVSLSLALSLGFDVEMRDGKRYSYFSGTSGITIILRIALNVSINLDVLVASVSIGGFAYLRLAVGVRFNNQKNTWWWDLYWGVNLYVQVRVLLWQFKWSYDLSDCLDAGKKFGGDMWIAGSDKEPNPESMNALPWYAPLLSIAGSKANDAANESGQSRTVQDYPALIPAAQAVLENLSMEGSTIRYADLGGTAYAFYIQPGAAKNRLTWVNIATGRTGNFDDFLTEQDADTYPNLQDYGFDVQAIPFTQEWIDHSEDAGAGNADFFRGKDMVVVSLLSTTGFHTETATYDGQSTDMQVPDDSRHYFFLAVHDPATDSFSYVLPGDYYDDPSQQYLSQWSVYQCNALEWTAKNVQLSLVENGDSCYATTLLDDAVSMNTNAEHGMAYTFFAQYRPGEIVDGQKMAGNAVSTAYSYTPAFGALTDPAVQVRQIRVADRMPNYGFISDTLIDTHYYLTTEGAEEGKWNLVRADMDGYGDPLVLDRDVSYYDVLWNPKLESSADVFYLWEDLQDVTDSEADQATYHLRTVRETFSRNPNNNRHADLSLTNTNLDVTLYSNQFSIQKVEDTVYLYWLELSGGQEATTSSVYRLKGIIFDPESRCATDDFVLAQFSTAHMEDVPVDMFLSADGMAYYTIRNTAEQNGESATVYAFRHGLKAHADMRSLTSTERLAISGSDVDFYIAVTNDGSANLEVIDLEMVLEDDDGNVIKGDDGQDWIIETLHAELLHPENNTRIVNGDAASTTTGEHAIYRVEDLPDDVVQDHFNVEETVTTWTDYSDIVRRTSSTTDPVVTALEAREILPGQTAGFKAAIHIPADWSGLKHITLRFAAGQNGLQNPSGSATLRLGEKRIRHDHSEHDIEATHRVYQGPGGEEYLHLTIYNHGENGEQLRLYTEMVLDDDPTSIYVDLPYDPEHTASGHTQNLDLPLSALLNGRTANVINMAVRAVDANEKLTFNNTFTIYPSNRNSEALRVTLQPADQSIYKGETADFLVAVAGGREPYSYQWEVSEDGGKTWQTVEGATEALLSLKNVPLDWTGRKYRCVITDHDLSRVETRAATLTVSKRIPITGDTSAELIRALLITGLFLLAGFWLTQRRKRKE